MIRRFMEVIPNVLYRGSSPTPEDVVKLKEDYNINKIVSLDAVVGKRIDRITKMLGIKHIIIPIITDMHTFQELLRYDLKELLLEDGPTFVHCFAGKDRTGLAIALVQCMYLGKDPEEAIKEAKSLGFGIGVHPAVVHLYEKLIRACKPKTDSNDADIVSNQREYKADNRDSYLDEGHQGSFAPYLSRTREYPYDSVYNYINEQTQTRNDYKHIDEEDVKNMPEAEDIPLIGVYNNDVGIHGVGPVENAGGFIYN